MKKKIKIVKKRYALLPVAIIMLAICITQLVQRNVRGLIIGTSPVVPPFTYIGGENGDELMGFDIKLIEEIAKDLKRNFTVKVMFLDDLLWSVEHGEIDMIVGAFTITEYRKQFVDYSKLYYRIPQVVVIREDDWSSRKIKTKEELGAKKNIGTLRGSAGISIISEISENEPILEDRWELVIELLLVGDVDAVILDIGSAKKFVSEYNNLTISSIELNLENYAVAVKKGNNNLLNKVNKTIDRLVDSGKHRNLIQEHVNSYLAYEDD